MRRVHFLRNLEQCTCSTEDIVTYMRETIRLAIREYQKT